MQGEKLKEGGEWENHGGMLTTETSLCKSVSPGNFGRGGKKIKIQGGGIKAGF